MDYDPLQGIYFAPLESAGLSGLNAEHVAVLLNSRKKAITRRLPNRTQHLPVTALKNPKASSFVVSFRLVERKPLGTFSVAPTCTFGTVQDMLCEVQTLSQPETTFLSRLSHPKSFDSSVSLRPPKRSTKTLIVLFWVVLADGQVVSAWCIC